MKDIYSYGYFTHSDGIQSWRRRALKFGDAMAAVCYAHDIGYTQLYEEFPGCFGVTPNGRFEQHGYTIEQQVAFIQARRQRIPRKVLEIGGGRGEVANTLVHLGVDCVSVELSPGADRWYRDTGEHYFGHLHRPAVPIARGIEEVIDEIPLSEFDTIMMVESLEHIPAEVFDPIWEQIRQQFKGRFIVVNWPDYHPIWIGRDAGPQEHCRLVDDALYDLWAGQAQGVLQRMGSHLVLEL